MEILSVKDKAAFEDAIENYEFHGFKPYNTSALGESDEIRIPIQSENSYVLPSKSFISICGTIVNEKGEAYGGKVVNNGFVHLFEEVKINIHGETVDRTRNPGITSLMKGICSYTTLDTDRLQNAGWVHPTKDAVDTIITGTKFNVCIPLSHLLGMAEDFKKILLNCKLELVLMRAKNTTHITNGPVSTITVTDIEWMVPIVKVSDIERLKLLNMLDGDRPLPIDFRSWQLFEHPSLAVASAVSWSVTTSPQLQKPRMVIVGLQTDRSKAAADGSQFDLCDVQDVSVYLNDKKYPYHTFGVDETNGSFGVMYEMYARFQESYYEHPPSPLLKRSDFIAHTPVFVIDCSKQNEELKSGACSTRVEISARSNIPPNTKAFCLIIHDRSVEYTTLTNIVTNVV